MINSFLDGIRILCGWLVSYNKIGGWVCKIYSKYYSNSPDIATPKIIKDHPLNLNYNPKKIEKNPLKKSPPPHKCPYYPYPIFLTQKT